ncbi:hypothetical protein RI367_004817 [Sorochytrium milnesiophthora]
METSTTPTFLPGAASLIDCIDKRLLVVLRDGRKLMGILRSYDQFANLVLQDTVERIYVDDCYGDIERGVFLIRGENVVLLGELNPEASTDHRRLRELPIDEVLVIQRQDMEQRQREAAIRKRVLEERGFSVDFDRNDSY